MTLVTNRSTAFRSPRFKIIAAVLLILAVVGGIFTYDHFFRTEPAPFFASDEDHFLYGSIGTEATDGIPYWIWLVLPRIFPEYLPTPGGYAALGVLAKDGREMPIGFSKVTIGFERVGINCAICHTGSYRLRPDEPPVIVPAAPAHQMAPQQYVRFLFACASDPRFTADTIMAEIAKNYRMPIADRLVYRFAIIPFTRRAILRLQEQDAWMLDRPGWGRGRIDPFNPVKFRTLEMPVDATIGNSDMEPIWNLNAHANAQHVPYVYHWDGLNTNLQEVVLSSAIGDGANTKWVDRDYAKWNETHPEAMSSLRRIQNYIGVVKPPKYPLPVDAALAAAGATVFQGECASCHAFDGARTGTLIPVGEVGTDPHRLQMWTPQSATTYNGYASKYTWKFSHFRSTQGYASVPLDGLWMRAPYLHNGSVPTLTDLLEPEATRPRFFWRGDDVYDGARVGFESTTDEARRVGTPFDVTKPGNSNAGHTYGTTLPPDKKRALVEYMKTL
jgi:processive rubber oxygenase RoxA-like protein